MSEVEKKAAGSQKNPRAASKTGSPRVNPGDFGMMEVEHAAGAAGPGVIKKLIAVNMAALAVSALSLAVAGGAIWVASQKKVAPPVAITEKGVVVQLTPVGERSLTDSVVAGFATECVSRVFSHSFNTMQRSVSDASECFTQQGWPEFLPTLNPLLMNLKAERASLIPVVRPSAVVSVGKSADGGIFRWKLETQLTLAQEGPNTKTIPRDYVATVIVTRVPRDESVLGIKVLQITLKPYSQQ